MQILKNLIIVKIGKMRHQNGHESWKNKKKCLPEERLYSYYISFKFLFSFSAIFIFLVFFLHFSGSIFFRGRRYLYRVNMNFVEWMDFQANVNLAWAHPGLRDNSAEGRWKKSRLVKLNLHLCWKDFCHSGNPFHKLNYVGSLENGH